MLINYDFINFKTKIFESVNLALKNELFMH